MAQYAEHTNSSAGPALVARRDYPAELWVEATLDETRLHGMSTAFVPEVCVYMHRLQVNDPVLFYRGMAQFALIEGFPLRQFEAAILASPVVSVSDELPVPQTGTELLMKDIPPLHYVIDGLMHEGLVLFGGKSKRGKSWLMLDLAMAIATGQYALRHYDCPRPAPVLYLALEDGERRVKRRLHAIQPHIARLDNLHMLYQFPKLQEGGIERLAHYIARYAYRLVVIDVLGKVEGVGKTGSKGYLEVYEMFTPLQDLLRSQHVCLTMLTHLRKSDADDVFDQILGSVAYQGAQDVLWALERKPNDDDALLHIRDKDDQDTTLALHFEDGHWKWMGEGDAYTLSREKRLILDTLADMAQTDHPDMTIQDIMHACGFAENKNVSLRKTLSLMVRDDLIHRTGQGKYTATLRGLRENKANQNDAEGIPF